MGEYEINEVLEFVDDFKREIEAKDDVNALNQAIMRLRDSVQNLNCIDSFDDLEQE